MNPVSEFPIRPFRALETRDHDTEAGSTSQYQISNSILLYPILKQGNRWYTQIGPQRD